MAALLSSCQTFRSVRDMLALLIFASDLAGRFDFGMNRIITSLFRRPERAAAPCNSTQALQSLGGRASVWGYLTGRRGDIWLCVGHPWRVFCLASWCLLIGVLWQLFGGRLARGSPRADRAQPLRLLVRCCG